MLSRERIAKFVGQLNRQCTKVVKAVKALGDFAEAVLAIITLVAWVLILLHFH